MHLTRDRHDALIEPKPRSWNSPQALRITSNQARTKRSKKMTKTRLILICITLIGLMIASGLFAEDVIRVIRKDGSYVDFPISEFDSIKHVKSDAPITSSRQLRYGDGNVYNTVRIGNQVWMAENLRTTRFIDGTPIPEVQDTNTWKSAKTPAMCWPHNNRAAYHDSYGILYNYEVASSNKLAPAGWRVPTEQDFEELLAYLNQNSQNAPKALTTNQRGFWKDYVGSNETGFTALPGYRQNWGEMNFNGKVGALWSSTPQKGDSSKARSLEFDVSGNGKTWMGTSGRTAGLFIRFIKE